MSGYQVPFTDTACRLGRRVVVPEVEWRGVPAALWNAKANNLRVKRDQLFNLLPTVLRNANHGDVDMWKNNLDHFLTDVPDQPTSQGLSRAPGVSNSLLDQIPLMGGWPKF